MSCLTTRGQRGIWKESFLSQIGSHTQTHTQTHKVVSPCFQRTPHWLYINLSLNHNCYFPDPYPYSTYSTVCPNKENKSPYCNCVIRLGCEWDVEHPQANTPESSTSTCDDKSSQQCVCLTQWKHNVIGCVTIIVVVLTCHHNNNNGNTPNNGVMFLQPFISTLPSQWCKSAVQKKKKKCKSVMQMKVRLLLEFLMQCCVQTRKVLQYRTTWWMYTTQNTGFLWKWD